MFFFQKSTNTTLQTILDKLYRSCFFISEHGFNNQQ